MLRLNFTQKTLTAVAGLAVTALVGCTPNNNTSDTIQHLDNQAIFGSPQWDVAELEPGSWYLEGNESPSAMPTADAEGNPLAPGDTPDVFLPNWVTFLDADTGCRITGRVVTIPSATEQRGDDFNTREYLYGRAPVDAPLPALSVKENNGVEYLATDRFVGPSEEGEAGWYNRLMARAFSGVFDIPNLEIEGNTDAPYGSSLLTGQALAYINFSCEKEEDLTDERWNAGLKQFKLLFPSEEDVQSQAPATEEPATIPTEEGEVAPAEPTELVEEPAPAEGETEVPAEESTPAEEPTAPAKETTAPAGE